MTPLFDAVVDSDDIGIGKPDRGLYLALEFLKVGHTEVAMIGNSLEKDIAGAQAAGIRVIWIDSEGREQAPPGCRRIASLRELESVVGRFEV